MAVAEVGVALVTVDVVTHDGRAESLVVGGVQSQLVCAACDGVEEDACLVTLYGQNLILGNSALAILGNHLSWAVVVVQLHSKVYATPLLLHNTLQECGVALADGAAYKLLLQSLMRSLILGHKE